MSIVVREILKDMQVVILLVGGVCFFGWVFPFKWHPKRNIALRATDAIFLGKCAHKEEGR